MTYAAVLPVNLGPLQVAFTSQETDKSLEMLRQNANRPDGYNNDRVMALMADPETARFETLYEAMDDAMMWATARNLLIAVLPPVTLSFK